MRLRRLIAAIVLGVATLLLTLDINKKSTSGLARLQSLWDRDLPVISKTIPYWNSIRKIQFITADNLAREWANGFKHSIPTTKGGKYEAEILFILQEPPKPTHVLIQIHLREIDSSRTVYEVGRTYELL